MAKKKNVLVIMTDQQRWDTLGCYGASTCRTPVIDQLAADGVRFDGAYTPTSPCSPARAALFTGLYPYRNNVPENGGNLNRDVPNLATELAGAGYNLGYSGKWHVDQAHVPSEYGFEGMDFPGYGYPPLPGMIEGLRYMSRLDVPPHYKDYLDSRGLEAPQMLKAFYGDNPGKTNQEMYALQSGTVEQSFECMVAEFACDLVEQFAQSAQSDDKPFFIWANYWGPHTPCFIPEPYYSMYDPSQIPEEPNFCETWENKPGAHDIYQRVWGLRNCGWEGWREIVARYWGYCTMIDDLTGRILDKLKELGLRDDTIVIYTTDHGDQMGAHGLIEKGPFPYEESWRIPMIVSHPDCQAPGTANEDLVYLTDLYPMILEAAGLDDPAVVDNESILPQALGQKGGPKRESLFCTFSGHILPAPFRMVRTKRYKFVYNLTDRGELYDLQQDPYELNNRIADPDLAEVKADLIEKMAAHMKRLGDPQARNFGTIRHVY